MTSRISCGEEISALDSGRSTQLVEGTGVSERELEESRRARGLSPRTPNPPSVNAKEFQASQREGRKRLLT